MTGKALHILHRITLSSNSNSSLLLVFPLLPDAIKQISKKSDFLKIYALWIKKNTSDDRIHRKQQHNTNDSVIIIPGKPAVV